MPLAGHIAAQISKIAAQIPEIVAQISEIAAQSVPPYGPVNCEGVNKKIPYFQTPQGLNKC